MDGYLGCHPKIDLILFDEAIKIAGSPVRLGALTIFIFLPVISTTVVITSFTDTPFPLPKLNTKHLESDLSEGLILDVSFPEKRSKALT